MTGASPALTAETVKAGLRTVLLGRRVEVHPQAGSTNDLVREAARRGEPEGLVVLAEEQVAGRGRLGRVWTAPPGCCVLCSVLLRPRFSPRQAFYITIAASLAIRRACRTALASDPHAGSVTIKWPNDVLIGGRKVSGVLSESEFGGQDWTFCVLGFGINVNLSRDDLGPLRDTATSLSAEAGRTFDRAALLASVLAELESLYLSLQGGGFGAVYAEWSAALETVGREVTAASGTETLTGRALRTDPDGALVLRLPDGSLRRVVAGDVLAGG